MAKIILVSKKITPTTWHLAQALKSHQHEVVLLTSYGEKPPQDANDIEFLGYFKHWTIMEGFRILPTLIAQGPQIIHLLLEEDRANSAQILLSVFAKSHPSCVLTTTLLNIRKGLKRRNPVRYLIEESDIITCPTVEALGHIRGLNVRSHHQGRGILPPFLSLQVGESVDSILNDDEILLFENLRKRPYIVMPFSEALFDPKNPNYDLMRVLAQKYKLVLWGTYSHWPVRERKAFASWMSKIDPSSEWIVTGSLGSVMIQILLKSASALFLAGRDFSPVEMTDYYTHAIKSDVPLILCSNQTSIHSDLWKNSINCWVLNNEQIQSDLIKLLNRPSLKLPESLTRKLAEDRHLIDSSLNELNRLYNRALDHL
jgi:hypothetical protein